MKYIPLNNFLLVEKKETTGLIVAGQNEDPNATIHGIVIEHEVPFVLSAKPTVPDNKQSLKGEEIIFVRGQARKIKLENKEYFLIPEDKVLIHVKNDS